MEKIEYRGVVDKSAWDRGPWDDEPDKIQWPDAATGLPCLIVRGPHGSLCGYVGVERGHPWHGRDYGSCKLFDVPEGEYDPDAYPNAHGGLTFASGCSHSPDPALGICHVPGPGETDDIWWLGFDCSYYQDYSPGLVATLRSIGSESVMGLGERPDVYRDVAYVTQCCTELAADVAKASA